MKIVFVAKGYINPKWQIGVEEEENYRPFSNHVLFGSQWFYHKLDPLQHAFLEDLVLYVAKGYWLLSSDENPWLRRLVLWKCGCVYFPSCRQMEIEVLPNMVEKTKEICVIPTLTSCIICTCSFDLWMSHVSFDIVIVVSFINTSWKPYHVTIGIFEVHNIASATMAN